MKDKLTNLFKKTMLLLVFALVGATQVKAQESYGLMIAGRIVTSENCNDLTVIPGVSGTVNYNPETKTLTLDSATIALNNDDNGIYNRTIDGLKINVIGENNINTKETSIYLSDETTTTITGGGTLRVENEKHPGIYIRKFLVIDSCTVNIKGSYGIKGGEAYSGLTIRNANVTAEGNWGRAILDIAMLTLDSCKIATPVGATFDEEQKAVMFKGGYAGSVFISTGDTEYYGINIAGTTVTSENCNDLSVIPGVSGTVNYNPETKTLTLDNSEIIYSENYSIENVSIDSLIVNVIGENNIKNNINGTIFWISCSSTITGGGTLTIDANSGTCITIEDTVVIENCTLNAKGRWGIEGVCGEEALIIRNANVTADGRDGAVADLNSLILDGCEITTPEGAAFNETMHYVALNGFLVTGKVIFTPNVVGYGLKIAGTTVTTENCNDLSVIPGVSGTVNYNPETNTLTLDNATITCSGDEENCIEIFSLDSLAIKVIGENNLKSGAATIYANVYPTTITGGGTLYLESNNCGIYFKNSLEIDSCTVNAKGYWGIAGDLRDENLTIRNATVTATGNAGSICDIATLTLDGCKIITPAGATFDENQHAIVLDGETVTDKVVITNDPTVGIKGVKATQPTHKQGIYSLDGVYLGNDFNALPKGIYIKDGKKVKK